jgi:hypothetical protein
VITVFTSIASVAVSVFKLLGVMRSDQHDADQRSLGAAQAAITTTEKENARIISAAGAAAIVGRMRDAKRDPNNLDA